MTTPTTLLRKRTSASRPTARRTGQKLGAVRLTPADRCPEGCTSPTAPEQDPVPAMPKAPRKCESPTVRFQQELAKTQHSDRWLEGMLTDTASAVPNTLKPAAHTPGDTVERQDSSLLGHVQKAFKSLLEDESGEDQDPQVVDRRRSNGPLLTSTSDFSIVDKGLDAISAVGRAAVGVATSLDNAIEELMHNWASPLATSNSPSAHNRELAAARGLRAGSISKGSNLSKSPSDSPPQGLPSLLGAQSQVNFLADMWAPSFDNFVTVDSGKRSQRHHQQRQQGRGSIDNDGSQIDGRSGQQSAAKAQGKENMQRHCPPGAQEPESPATPQRRASSTSASCTFTEERQQQTAAVQLEVDSMRSQQEDYLRLRTELQRLRVDLSSTSSKCAALSQENIVLREKILDSPTKPDPIADQVRNQLEALLAEKAKLALENERLAHENSGLQELLHYTMHQAGPEQQDDDCDSLHSDALSDWSAVGLIVEDGAIQSAENGSPLKPLPASKTGGELGGTTMQPQSSVLVPHSEESCSDANTTTI